MELGRPILPPISSIDHYTQQQPQQRHPPRPSSWSAPLEPPTTSTAAMSPDNKIPFFDYPNRRPLPPQPKLAPSPSPLSHDNPKTIAIRNRMRQDMDQVANYCTNMRETIQQHQHTIDMIPRQPWLEDMIGQANEILNALLRLQKQQMAVDEEKRFAQTYQGPATAHTYASANGGVGVQGARFYDQTGHEDDMSQYDNSAAEHMSDAMAGARLRRKRRRPAFQGRCHSCNISETPEWRRGPDGARTLCNACGLHYAKLERKRQAAEAKAKSTEAGHEVPAVPGFRTLAPCPVSSPTSSSTSSSLQDEPVMTP